MTGSEALEIVSPQREALEARAHNAELHLKRARLNGASVDDEAVDALVTELARATARVEDLTARLVVAPEIER